MRGRYPTPFQLYHPSHLDQLKALVKQHPLKTALGRRAAILLALAEGQRPVEIANRLDTTSQTVWNTRVKYDERRDVLDTVRHHTHPNSRTRSKLT